MRNVFFKYHDADTTKIVLNRCTRRWSCPSQFNDPFDNDFNFHLSDDHDLLAKNHLQRAIEFLTRREPILGSDTNHILARYEWMRQNLRGEITDNVKQSLLASYKQNLPELIVNFNAGMDNAKKMLDDTGVFCISEVNDNILMWSHYARNHTGAVLEFRSVPDSPLLVAKPVRYSDTLPIIEDIAIGNPMFLTELFLNTMWFTKSSAWAYEKEWRIAVPRRNPSNKAEDLKFNPDELKSIYLGCKISSEDKREIASMAQTNFRNVQIYQARKHPRKFALDFDLISS